MSALFLAMNQVQSMKEKIDPEVFELLNQSAHEAIASAHHFLDACEKAIDSISSQPAETPEQKDDDAGNVFPITREG